LGRLEVEKRNLAGSRTGSRKNYRRKREKPKDILPGWEKLQIEGPGRKKELVSFEQSEKEKRPIFRGGKLQPYAKKEGGGG